MSCPLELPNILRIPISLARSEAWAVDRLMKLIDPSSRMKTASRVRLTSVDLLYLSFQAFVEMNITERLERHSGSYPRPARRALNICVDLLRHIGRPLQHPGIIATIN